MRRLGDPFVSSLLVLSGVTAGGIVALALAWRGAAATSAVAEQMPYVVSGGFGGVGLVGFAGGMLVIQTRRWAEARRRAQFYRVVNAAEDLVTTARERSTEREG